MTDRTVRSALGYSFAHRYTEAALRFGLLIVLARLIEPAGFGAFAVATAVASLLIMLCRSGPAAWIVRAGEAEAGLRTPAAVAAASCALAAAALWASADLIAAGAGLPRAAPLLRFYAVGLLLLPLDIVFGALLRRRLAFARLALIGILAVAAGGAVAVALAARGFAETALAAGAVTEGAVLALGCLIAGRGDVSRLGRGGGPLRAVLLFGARVGGGNVLADLGRLAAPLVIGASLGAAPAGLYDRAARVVMIFGDLVMNAVRPVVLPSLAAARRAGAPLADAYLFKIAALSLIAWPFFAALAVAAEPVVLLLLGPNWTEAVPLVRLACLLGLALPFYETDNAFLIAAGRERALLRIQLVAQSAGLIGLVIGARDGVAAALLGLAFGQVARGVLSSLALGASFNVPISRQLAASGASAGIAALVAATAAAFTLWGTPDHWLARFALLAATGTACAGVLTVGIFVLRHPARGEVRLLLSSAGRLFLRDRNGADSGGH